MNNATYQILEFDKIKTELATYALSGLGKKLIESLAPVDNRPSVVQRLLETTEMRRILDAAGHIPLHGLVDLTETLDRVERGAVLDPVSLTEIADFLRGCRKLKGFMAKYREQAPLVNGYAAALTPFNDLEELIELSIENGQVSSGASSRLKKLRSAIDALEGRIRDRVQTYLTSAAYREYLQEAIVTMKEGRYCLAVKASCRNKIEGTVMGTSGSGQTVFMEPAPVRKLANDLVVLKTEAADEVYQILAGLTGEVLGCLPSLRLNLETMAAYDFALAKAKYSRAMAGVPAQLDEKTRIVIRGGRHPLLGADCVPLDFFIGYDYRTLLITGPNTGGKTVALKTIGLFVLMTQAGLHVPAAKGTSIGIFRRVLADIGDAQSIAQSLSTFSGHLKNIIGIQKAAGPRTLVLIDEIGTGTDPAEGAAIAAAVLEDLADAGALTVATTHYGELKRFAQRQPGFYNGRMAFDPETLRPLYRLEIGVSGRSNGLWIAERLGMRRKTLAKARLILGSGITAGDPEENEAIAAMPPAASGALTAGPEERGTTVPVETGKAERPFRRGDAVYIGTAKERGILCDLPDAKGEVTVLVRGKRIKVNRKRIKLHIPAEQLYPDPDHYDLDIIFLTKEDRKIKHDMSRKHLPGQERILTGEDS